MLVHSLFLELSVDVVGVFSCEFFFFKCLFLREAETECEWLRGRERGRQNPKEAPGSELSAQSPTWGSNS